MSNFPIDQTTEEFYDEAFEEAFKEWQQDGILRATFQGGWIAALTAVTSEQISGILATERERDELKGTLSEILELCAEYKAKQWVPEAVIETIRGAASSALEDSQGQEEGMICSES